MKKINVLFCIFLIFSITLMSKPQTTMAKVQDLQVESRYVTIYSLKDKSAIYELKAHEQMYPASLTKIMTTLVAIEHIDDLHKEIVLGKDIFEGLAEEGASVAGYDINDKAELLDLLYGTMLPSGADAARAIAKHVAGSEEAFVKLMNDRAEQMKLEHTHFMNTTGLHHDDHYSTTADMAKILEIALENKTFYEIFTADDFTSADGKMHFVNTKNSILDIIHGDKKTIMGSKTGFTLEGGLCLASLLKIDGEDYISISGYAGNDFSTMQHYKDAVAIGEFIQTQYERKTVYHANEAIHAVPITYGNSDEVEVVLHEDITMLVRKDEKLEESILQNTIIAPVNTREPIAQLQIGSKNVAEKRVYPLYAAETVSRNWIEYLLNSRWFYIFVILFSILTLIFFIGKPRIVRTCRRIKRRRLRSKQRRVRR